MGPIKGSFIGAVLVIGGFAAVAILGINQQNQLDVLKNKVAQPVETRTVVVTPTVAPTASPSALPVRSTVVKPTVKVVTPVVTKGVVK